jgi:hypothetical protein
MLPRRTPKREYGTGGRWWVASRTKSDAVGVGVHRRVQPNTGRWASIRIRFQANPLMRNLFPRLFGGSSNPPRVGTDRISGEMYSALRHQALSTQRTEVGIPAPPPEAPAWGILMETGYPQATATLLALSDGTTSLYLSSGGGVIGGHAHQSVRQANAALLETANQYYQHLRPRESFPVPATGHTLFYILTDSGVLSGGSREDDLGHGRHPLSPLFHAGHRVITQLRLMSESADQDV